MKLSTIKTIGVFEHVEVDSYLLAKKELSQLIVELEKRVGSILLSTGVFVKFINSVGYLIQESFDIICAGVILTTMHEFEGRTINGNVSADVFYEMAWKKIAERYLVDGEDGDETVVINQDRYLKRAVIDADDRLRNVLIEILGVVELDEESSYYKHYENFILYIEDFLTTDEILQLAYDMLHTGFESIYDGKFRPVGDMYITFNLMLDVMILSISNAKLPEYSVLIEHPTGTYIPDDTPKVLH